MKYLKLFACFAGLLPVALPALEASLLAHWTFDDPGAEQAVAMDNVAEHGDVIAGKFRYMPGVKGEALRFDGYTTVIDRAAESAPKLEKGFTIEVWVAQAAYPWNRCPVVSQADPKKMTGYRLLLGTRGEAILEIGTGTGWYSLTSEDWVLPLRSWLHIAATYDPELGLKLFIDGEPAGRLEIAGRMKPAPNVDMRIGSLHEPAKPAHIHRDWGTLPTWWTLDGQLDELKIYGEPLESAEIAKAAGSSDDVSQPEMSLRRMPSGPKGADRFGANYTNLKFYEQWDDLWRVDNDPDVVVQFDESPVRLVFWRGTRYGPAWVSENDLWMTDQSVEAWDHDKKGAEGCHEHMQDRHCRYSHVRIIESNSARVVVHWRYAPVSANQSLWRPDPRTGKACWVDEYYTIYPDATGMRKVSWTTGTLGNPRQFQETLPLTHPGQYFYDLVHNPYAHVANLKGEIETCDFAGRDTALRNKTFPEDLILQRYNYKSENKPFIIFQKGNNMWLRQEGTYGPNRPAGCNHWPVGQAACDGRTIQTADRPGHVMGFPISFPPVHESGDRSWWAGFYGMGQQSVEELLQMAQGFNFPAELTLETKGYKSHGFDPGQRAWVVENAGAPDRALKLTLQADEKRPLYNPALVIRNAGDSPVQLKVNGELVPFDKDHRFGLRHHLEGTDLILWLKHSGTEPLQLEVISS